MSICPFKLGKVPAFCLFKKKKLARAQTEMTGDLGKFWKLWYVNTGRHSQGPSLFGQINLSFEEVTSLWTQPHPLFRGVVLSISRERFHRKTGHIHKHLEIGTGSVRQLHS